MLNEERVKHMVKLALYETKSGSEELKANCYFKKDYISLNVLCSVLWLTGAYVILVALLGMTFISVFIENLSVGIILAAVIAVITLYVALLIACIMLTKRHYKKKHARSYHRIKRLKQDLTELERLYEKEDINAEVIRD